MVFEHLVIPTCPPPPPKLVSSPAPRLASDLSPRANSLGRAWPSRWSAGIGSAAKRRAIRFAAKPAIHPSSFWPRICHRRPTSAGSREFQERHSRLDVLINNAGAIFATRQESVDGIEMTLALNHLGYFLLTTLLLDLLQASAPARIVNVASHSHESVKAFDFEDPQAASARRNYPRTERANFFYTMLMPWAHPCYVQYAQSKLANVLFTYELARRVAGAGVTVNALHPGFVRTDFMAGNGSYGWFMRFWAHLFGTTPERGAETLIYLASSPEVEGVTGKYFAKRSRRNHRPRLTIRKRNAGFGS